MLSFITALLHTKLKVQGDTEIKLERAHRALAPKPKESSAPPRSIIVRFLDFSVKQIILQQAWKQRDIEFEGQRVHFDQDYSPDLQGKRKGVREVIKQLKENNIKAQSPYPAQLKLFLATGVRVFPTLVEAQSTLKELGVDARIEERDILERELTQDKWSTQENRRMQLNPTDVRAIIRGDNGTND
ncbi:LINE-1 type transposase domain containing protein 1 [Dissostichus eleginoides]|uniref:LINE-1 type transposase domain containing protein 1 n=1 Tax=Dissostichus eleginoides TaxID=100907 RepID=A0AAD9B2E8_DISEL|nr:LINE-1 type transposase domain containing protein 1 [Dissostichus eleginoides]